MAKFNGNITLTIFKKYAVQLEVFHNPADDSQWQEALSRARTWRRAAAVLPTLHPMRAIAQHEDGHEYEVEVRYKFNVEPAEYMDGHLYLQESLELYDIEVDDGPDLDYLTREEEEELHAHVCKVLRDDD